MSEALLILLGAVLSGGFTLFRDGCKKTERGDESSPNLTGLFWRTTEVESVQRSAAPF
jgi:hypothetical protein